MDMQSAPLPIKSRGGKAWFDNMKETKSRPISPVTEKSLKKRNFFIVFGFTSVTLLCVIFFLFGCRIKTISVENTAIAEEEAILEAIGIKTGRHIYAISKEKISAAAAGTSPYIKAVTVKRRLPSKLRIVVEEYEPLYSTEHDGAYLILSDTLRVLENTPDKAAAAEKAGTLVILPEIKTAEVGKTLVFTDQDDGNAAAVILSVFHDAAFPDKPAWIDVSEKFDITANLMNKYTLFYGDSEKLSTKIETSLRAIRYLTENMYGVTGNLYATGNTGASFEITGVAESE